MWHSTAVHCDLNVFRNLTNEGLQLSAVLLGRIFCRRLPALTWASRDVTVTAVIRIEVRRMFFSNCEPPVNIPVVCAELCILVLTLHFLVP